MNMAAFASGTLVVLGVLLTVLGIFAAGSVELIAIGLAAVLAGGILGVFARQPA
jgi:hypothetical protein